MHRAAEFRRDIGQTVGADSRADWSKQKPRQNRGFCDLLILRSRDLITPCRTWPTYCDNGMTENRPRQREFSQGCDGLIPADFGEGALILWPDRAG